MSSNNGFLFFIGLLIVSIAVGSEHGSIFGFYVLGAGMIVMSLLDSLISGKG